MLDLRKVLLLVICGVLATGCKRKPSAEQAAVDAAKPTKTLRRKPKSQAELRTTSADIYLGNLDGEIEELEKPVAGRPTPATTMLSLSAALHTRGRYRGDLDEIQRGIDLTSKCATLEPGNARCYVARAQQEQSLHRFGQARTDLDRARQHGGDPRQISDLEVEFDWNDGRYDKAIPAIRQARLSRPSPATWMREAQLEHDLGHEDAADAAFEAAEDMITDTTPLVVAHLDVERGIQKMQTGRLDEACVFFREAVDRMPTYIAANEHLAETLHSLGQNAESTRIYENVVRLSDDPEFMHALGELYAASGRAAEAAALRQRATARYEALVKKYPEAMYWHASEFYLSTGNRERAHTLLRENVELRPNSNSFVALARAELELGRTANAKTSIDKALAMPLVSARLFWTASRIYDKHGDADAGADYRRRAERLNPRVAKDEP